MVRRKKSNTQQELHMVLQFEDRTPYKTLDLEATSRKGLR